ncbi:hypothetical protein CFC21_022105, partial [Triticum aestivum]
AAAAAAAPG